MANLILDLPVMGRELPRGQRCELCGEPLDEHTTWEDGSRTCPDALYGKEVL